MNNILDSFILVDDKTINNLNVTNTFKVSYLKEKSIVSLNLEKMIDQEFFLTNTNDDFNLSKDNFIICGEVTLDNIGCLYGKQDGYNRIALDDTTLGISINAYSRVSKYNITVAIGEIKVIDDKKIIRYNLTFPPGSLADKLFISTNLYVKNVKTISNIYGSKTGMVLGTIHSAILNIEGNGSIFPIRIISDKSEPLWYVDLNFDDLNNPFCQNTICLNINSAHYEFDKIGSEDITIENSTMWKEILVSFLSQILLSLNEFDKNSLYEGEIFEEGSIGMFLQYIVKSFDIGKNLIDNPVLLNKNLLSSLDKIMK